MTREITQEEIRSREVDEDLSPFERDYLQKRPYDYSLFRIAKQINPQVKIIKRNVNTDSFIIS